MKKQFSILFVFIVCIISIMASVACNHTGADTNTGNDERNKSGIEDSCIQESSSVKNTEIALKETKPVPKMDALENFGRYLEKIIQQILEENQDSINIFFEKYPKGLRWIQLSCFDFTKDGCKEIILFNCDITWDDYNSGSYEETWLHFSFSDGTEVDKELSYFPSIVENVDFVDITGDGKDEVLIYRYFANTATEYTLINFFQIEENCVTEISPELELEELANNVWNVIDIDFSEEEYDMPVFTMESYEKMNMVTYPDKRVLVGYQGGGWQILGWID